MAALLAWSTSYSVGSDFPDAALARASSRRLFSAASWFSTSAHSWDFLLFVTGMGLVSAGATGGGGGEVVVVVVVVGNEDDDEDVAGAGAAVVGSDEDDAAAAADGRNVDDDGLAEEAGSEEVGVAVSFVTVVEDAVVVGGETTLAASPAGAIMAPAETKRDDIFGTFYETSRVMSGVR